MKRQFTRLTGAVLAILVLASCSQGSGDGGSAAESYPEEPVEVIIGFGPGGETDVVGRMVLSYAEEEFGESFAVVNMPGASGEVGWGELANSEPNGYTIGMINPPTFVQVPIAGGGDAQYGLDEITPVANVSTDPGAIVVMGDHPASSLDELLQMAEENPSETTVATGGAQTSESVTLGELSEKTNVEFDEITYDGTASMSSALQGGHVDVAVMNVSSALGLVENGAKVLAVGSTERSDYMPEVPTYQELDIDITHVSHRGFAVPAGTDPAIIEKLDSAIGSVFENEEFLQRAEDADVLLNYLNHEEYAELLNDMEASYTDLWERNPWQ